MSDSDDLISAEGRSTDSGSGIADWASHLVTYRARLKRLIAVRLDRRVLARVDASDVVQDVMRLALADLPNYLKMPQATFYAWLRRIALNRIVDIYRLHIQADKRTVLKEQEFSVFLSDESIAELAAVVVSSDERPDRQAVSDELDAQVARALGQLSEADRELLVMRHLESLSVDEVASILEVSKTTVTTRHYRALRRLRELLDLGSD